MTEPSAPTSVISRARVEMLVDGIFAIALTILVLDLKVPEIGERPSIGELARALRAEAPTFGSYLISFWVLGLMWYRHNRLFRHVTRITRRLLGLQLLQLAAAAFFPFSASLFGRYPMNALTQTIYAGCVLAMLVTGLGFWVAAYRVGALDSRLGADQYRAERRHLIRGSVAISVVLALSLYQATR